MKKILGGLFVGLLFVIPTNSYAVTADGIEFLSPLVQTIITLLQDRIAELTAEIAVLRANTETPSCAQLGSTPTNTLLTNEEVVRIKAEFAQKYLDLDLKIGQLQTERDAKIVELRATYDGATEGLNKAENDILREYKTKINTLQVERNQLQLEERRQLSLQGVY